MIDWELLRVLNHRDILGNAMDSLSLAADCEKRNNPSGANKHRARAASQFRLASEVMK